MRTMLAGEVLNANISLEVLQKCKSVDQGCVGEDFRIVPYSVLSADFVVPYSSV